METLDRLFDAMRTGIISMVDAAGPWTWPALAVMVIFFGITFRDRIASPGGLILLLAVAAFAVLVRAAQLGKL